MISVGIDTSSLQSMFDLNQTDIDNLMDFTVKEITARFAQEWEKKAVETLHSSRQEYISNLVVVDEGIGKGAVVLTGWLPNAIEQGMDPYDMKEGMLEGPNAKTSKTGNRFNIIPFTWGTPGALVENFTGGIMPDEIHHLVKAKPQDIPMSGGGKRSAGLSVDELPKQYVQPIKKQIQLPHSKKFVDYQHKTSIYAGITRMKDPVTNQNSYMSFRVVSDGSNPSSWIHPGFVAANLAEKALAEFDVPSETGRIIDIWLNSRL